MQDLKITKKSKNLEKYGLKDVSAHWNLSPEELQKITISKGMGKETSNGTLAINTGKFTGRSPQDRFLVKDDYTKDRVWWGKVNKPFDADKFDVLQSEIVNYLSGKEIYVRDGYVCADLAQVDPLKDIFHVLKCVDGNAHPSHFIFGSLVRGIQA